MADTDEVDEDIWFEYDEQGNVIGIKIWNAGENVIRRSLLEIERYAKGLKEEAKT
ncbi:DUF2283 domain-containing protein [Thermococcus prieurii]